MSLYCSAVHFSAVQSSAPQGSEIHFSKVFVSIVKWSEVKWSEVWEFLIVQWSPRGRCPASSLMGTEGYHLHNTAQYTVYCIPYTVHCTLYIVHCAVYSVHCLLSTVHYTLYTTHSTLHTLHSTLYTLHFTKQCKIRSVHHICKQFTENVYISNNVQLSSVQTVHLWSVFSFSSLPCASTH